MIEREQLVKLLREAIDLHDGICRVVGRKQVEKVADYLLDKGVTIPVRCRDCKHWYEAEGVCLKIYSDGAVSAYAWQYRHADDFCSYGERKDKCK